MRRWILTFCPLVALFILASYGFTILKTEVPEQLRVTEPMAVLFPKNQVLKVETITMPPYLGTQYVGFKEALAFRESGGNYLSVNTYGYLGKYQFGLGTLALVGVYNGKQFLKNPKLQERVFQMNISRNKWILRREIESYVGKTIRGVKITESGILAAAHLAGPGNVQKYLHSNGKIDVADGYGTTLTNYLEKFSGYDISLVSPKRNARI
ncbi:hypothetical protein [Maribacter sp. 2210JD10-5]|uniref:hypothetical protein n=1 Tax=Maribacter sp. 2210JD10-5 TaxID=3386272 RepID=UPI0039BC4243